MAGGDDKSIKIIDKRELKITKIFYDIHARNLIIFFNCLLLFISFLKLLGYINCVRWSPSGDMLASASADKLINLLDFRAGRILNTGSTSDGSKSFHPLLNPLMQIIRSCDVCLFHLIEEILQTAIKKQSRARKIFE